MSTRSWLEVIRRIDKGYDKAKRHLPAYEWGSGRVFEDGPGVYANNPVIVVTETNTDTSTNGATE